MTDIDWKHRPEDKSRWNWGQQQRFYENITQTTQMKAYDEMIEKGYVPMGNGPLSDCFVPKAVADRMTEDFLKCDFETIEQRWLVQTYKVVTFRGRKRSASGWMTFVKTIPGINVVTALDLKNQFPGVQITDIYGDGALLWSR